GSIGVAGKDGKDGVSINGNGTITAGRDGVDGVDGSIGAKGKDGASVVLNGKDGSIGLTGPKGADGKPGANASIQVKDGAEGVNGTGKDGLPGENGQTRIIYETKDKDGKTITEQLANLNDGLIFTGNNEDTLNRHKLNTVVKVQGEGVDKAASDKFKSAKGNINVKANGAGTLEVQLAKDLDLTRDGSVTTGNTTINNDGLTIKDGPRITQDGINANNTRITNVAPGVDGTDAVNVNQLKGAVNHLDNKINRNKREARSGIAGSNAAAALPQVYLPGKSMVAVSAGTFKREGAIALGYSRSSDNGKVILKLQGNANTRGDVGAGVGLGYQW
ncbi:TPA: YadA family autotransporter adhesin, partial [Mannheimia haemolytica]